MDMVMLATGAGAGSRRLHAAARRIADEEGACLLVVHVLTGASYKSRPARLRLAIRREMQWLLRALLAPPAEEPAASVGRLTVDVREGDISEQLIEVADSNRPDMVVLGALRPDASEGSDGPTENCYSRLIAFLQSRSIRVEVVEPG